MATEGEALNFRTGLGTEDRMKLKNNGMRHFAIMILFGAISLEFSLTHADTPFSKITVGGQPSYIVPAGYLRKNDSDVRGRLREYRLEAQYEEISGFWTPSSDDVATAAKAAYRFLQSAKQDPRIAFPYLASGSEKHRARAIENAKNELGLVIRDYGKYQGQYVGFIIKGKRRIICNYLDLEGWNPDFLPDLSARFMDVNDGGHHFWQIEYDLESKTCSNLQINGPWEHDW